MSGDAFQCPENVLAGLTDAATGNFTAAGNGFAAAGDQAGGPEPVPQVTGKPAAVTAAPPWTAPQPAGDGQVTVSRDVLRSVAAAMRSELATLDSAVSQVRRAGAASAPCRGGRPPTRSVATWPTPIAAA
jgi:hypothetical protein